jgi:hypothetical protein
VALKYRTEVEECSWDRGRGYSSVPGSLVGWEDRAMQLDSGPRVPRTRGGHLDAGSAAHAPERGRGPVTQHRAGSAGEHGRHPASVLGQQAMPDQGVDAPMDAPQAPQIDAVSNGAAIEPKL